MKPPRAVTARPLAGAVRRAAAILLAWPAVASVSCGRADLATTLLDGAQPGTERDWTGAGGASERGGTVTSGGSTAAAGADEGSGTATSGGSTAAAGADGGGGAAGAEAGAGAGGAGGPKGAGRDARIIAVGDTGEGNLAQNEVADRMSEKCLAVGGCHAVMMNGDNFYNHGVLATDDPQWGPKFEQPYDRPGLNGLPFFAVLGNHDHGPTSNGARQAQIAYTLLPVGDGPGMRRSDKWRMPAPYYDVRIGDVHLFGIDTVDFISGDQAADMSARVAASDATWKIVFGHHPRYTSGEHFFDNEPPGMFDMQQAIYCGADMYMAGHDHNLEFIDKGRDERCPGTYFAVSGAGSKTRPASALVPTDPKQLFYTDEIEGFAYMQLEGRALRFEFIDRRGVVLYATTLVK
ncbi:tartrate-resistant acid phosphatase type 5 family protein [Sorangium sp. So ce1036]|uniref:purple acid phosphatase family protein n=1 Tax=Sorangium sp. So ce1036 TaxID=3133328 RepID=UPI003F043D64